MTSSSPLARGSHRVLVTGGVRSGKSRYAEQRLAAAPEVSYLAPSPAPDPESDPEWAARIAEHQARRPPSWHTLETTDLAAALRAGHPAVLIDSLGSWVSAVVDELGTWEQPLRRWRPAFEARLDPLVDAWQESTGLVVAVTNEVGWGLVSEHRSGRVFTDLLGQVNQRLAAGSDEVVLVVAGRALVL